VRILSGDIHLLDLRTRLPFRYGMVTMTSSPHAFVRVRLEHEGRESTGISADLLPPKWFTKNPDQPLDDEILEMLTCIERAIEHATDLIGNNPFDIWWQLHERQADWGRQQGLAPLLTHFGTSLVERAMLEAFCRNQGRPFAQLLHENRLGIELGRLHPELHGLQPADLLPSQPLPEIIARHTVGMLDPLETADISAQDRLNDGLPQSLTECIAEYGLRHFKIKLSGEVERDKVRLKRLAALLARHAPSDFAFSLDGNEQFHSAGEFRDYWQAVRCEPSLAEFLSHLMYVEQPLHRQVALDAAASGELATWSDRPPLIIDESDSDFDRLPVARSLGYAGTSHKNCKGVFHGVASACLTAWSRRQYPDRPAILSGEDLANIGPVALPADLAVCAALGISSVERNGHHYFAGLSMFPTEMQREMLAAHGDLYHTSPQDWPSLSIEDGRIQLGSVNSAPLGVGIEVRVEEFTPASEYRRNMMKR
jgi:hypothetical protein